MIVQTVEVPPTKLKEWLTACGIEHIKIVRLDEGTCLVHANTHVDLLQQEMSHPSLLRKVIDSCARFEIVDRTLKVVCTLSAIVIWIFAHLLEEIDMGVCAIIDASTIAGKILHILRQPLYVSQVAFV